MNMYIIWAAAILVFGILEGVTAQLVSIWFVFGAAAGLIAAFCQASILVQVLVFILVTILALLVTRPLVKKFIHPKMQKTNADRCIGGEGVVVEAINNLEAVGQVKINGNIWTARSADNANIEAGRVVVVQKIDGVKLIVLPKL